MWPQELLNGLFFFIGKWWKGRVGKGLTILIHFLPHESKKVYLTFFMFYTCVYKLQQQKPILSSNILSRLWILNRLVEVSLMYSFPPFYSISSHTLLLLKWTCHFLLLLWRFDGTEGLVKLMRNSVLWCEEHGTSHY